MDKTREQGGEGSSGDIIKFRGDGSPMLMPWSMSNGYCCY